MYTKNLSAAGSKQVISFLYVAMNGENVRISPFIPLPKKKRKANQKQGGLTHPRKCPRICQ